MLKTNDYQGCLHALSTAVSQSVVTVQLACTPGADPSAKAAAGLLETMRGFYTRAVKPLFDNKKADDALEREIGAAFGALVTHLQAIHASWLVFSTSNNKHISLDTLSASFSLQAVQAGQNCHNAGVESVARLLKDEAQMRNKADIFVEIVTQHVKQTDRLYNSDPYSSYRSGYSPMCICLSEQSGKQVKFEFHYWDGVDACYASLGQLFPGEADKKLLEAFAAQAFGPGVRFKDNHSTIEID